MEAMNPRDLQPYLESAGFASTLCVEDVRPWDGLQNIPLLVYSRLPKDVRTSAVAVIRATEDSLSAVQSIKGTGAPVVFVVRGIAWECWRQETCIPKRLASGNRNDLGTFFKKHKSALNPDAIYRAKVWGRVDSTTHQLEFVDIGLMTLVEGEVGKKVSQLIERTVGQLAQDLNWENSENLNDSQAKWLIQAPFWLLAGKILQDKKVAGFIRLDLMNPEEVFARLASHYNSKNPQAIDIPSSRRRALLKAAASIKDFAALDLLTTESLGHVYESALINDATRKRLGTHCTPQWLIDYIIGRLRPFIAKMPVDGRRVFEPACGHAGFLVATLRLLDELRPADFIEPRESYLRKRLRGVDVDAFSQDVARLALTLADVPHPNGWTLNVADVFQDNLLAKEVAKADIVLANPPFENLASADRISGSLVNKAAEIFKKTVENLSENALFGFVLPQGFMTSKEASACRQYIQHHCEIHEITLFADKVFKYGDPESAIIIGQKKNARSNHLVRYQRVREKSIANFKHTLTPSSSVNIKQSELCSDVQKTLLLPELKAIWDYLKENPRLKDEAVVGQGLIHKHSPKDSLGNKVKLYESSKPKKNFVLSYEWSSKQMTHLTPVDCWISTNKEHIRRPLHGTVTGSPQVLLNSHPARGPWRLKALLDKVGRPVTGQFLIVRPKNASRLTPSICWALLNSPLANAYSYCFSSKRDVQAGQMREFPIPALDRKNLRPLNAAIESYLNAAQDWSISADRSVSAKSQKLPLFDGEEVESNTNRSEDSLKHLHWRVDAEVLKLYNLPPLLERLLLELFSDTPRRGVPFLQNEYFPKHFKDLNKIEELLLITADWGKTSKRKVYLVEKKIRKEANASEIAELARLKFLTEARGEYFAPLPLPQLRKMRDDMIQMGTWVNS